MEVKTLDTKPVIPSYAHYYYNIFIRLHACRGVGMSGIEPITIEAVASYCMATDNDFDEILDIVTGIDAIYRKDATKHAEQSKPNRKN